MYSVTMVKTQCHPPYQLYKVHSHMAHHKAHVAVDFLTVKRFLVVNFFLQISQQIHLT